MPEKLIRDRIPAIAAARGQHLHVRTAVPDEMPRLLRDKLLEEATEAAAADASDLLEELADVTEVVHALAAVYGYSPADVEAARAKKAGRRGGFEQRLVLTITTPKEQH